MGNTLVFTRNQQNMKTLKKTNQATTPETETGVVDTKAEGSTWTAKEGETT
jgi:hypothetical protein